MQKVILKLKIKLFFSQIENRLNLESANNQNYPINNDGNVLNYQNNYLNFQNNNNSQQIYENNNNNQEKQENNQANINHEQNNQYFKANFHLNILENQKEKKTRPRNKCGVTRKIS